MITPYELIGILGGWTVIITAIITYLANRFTDKLTTKWKERADSNVARLQGEIDKNNNTLNTVLGLYGSGHYQAQDRRIKAIEVLWVNLAKFKEVIPHVAHLIYNVFMEKEIEGFWTRETDNQLHNFEINRLKNFDFQKNLTDYFKFIDEIELERPFMGEKIWFYFDIYKVFLGRIAVLIEIGTKNQKFEHWHKDQLLKQLFKDTLSQQEVEYIYSLKINSMNSTIALLQNKLLFEINRTLSGEQFADSALDRVKRFEKAFALQEKSKN